MGSRGTRRSRWLASAVLAFAGFWPLLTASTSEAVVVVSRVTVTNVSDTSFTVSWVTNTPTRGYVRYGTTAGQLNSRAEDVRGANQVGYTHYVQLISLLAGTRYYYAVTSGDTTVDRDSQGSLSVTTGPTLGAPQPPAPNYVSGHVLKFDGVTPANGVIIHVFLQHNPSAGPPTNSARLSALTNETGAFSIDVSLARVTNHQSYFTYALSGDRVYYQADGGPNNQGAWQSVDSNTTSQGASATQIEIALLNPDPPTPTASPTWTPTRTDAMPTPTAALPASPSPSPTPTVSPTPAASPTPVVEPPSARTPAAQTTPTSRTTPTPTAPPAPTASPGLSSRPTATSTASFLRPPPPVSGVRPPGSPSSGYSQKAAPARSDATSTPAATPTLAPASPAAASLGLEQPPPAILALVTVAGILVASGLGLVTVGVVSGLRRRPF